MNALRDFVSKMEPNDTVLVSGDFNLPNLIWYTNDVDDLDDSNMVMPLNTVMPLNVNSRSEKEIIDTCHELGLLQICNYYNDENHMLDLLWTNDPNLFTCNIRADEQS